MSKISTDNESKFFQEFHSCCSDELHLKVGKVIDTRNSMEIMATLAYSIAEVMVQTMTEAEACIFSKSVGDYMHSMVHVIAEGERNAAPENKH